MKKLIEKFRGRKYYMILIFDGAQDFLSSNIFTSKKDAKIFIFSQSENRTMRDAKILSFRTKEPIVFLNK